MTPLEDRFLAVGVALPFLLGIGYATLANGDPPPREVVVRLTDPAIVESSGLVARDGLLVTANDSGDVGRTFVVDDQGRTVGHSTFGESTDVEALAPIGEDVLVGDIGDNAGARDTVSLLRVPVARDETSVDPATAVRLVYPDGPQDAETLMVDPVSGDVLVADKVLFGAGTLYQVPPTAVPDRVGAAAPTNPVRLREVGTVRGLATDGAFFPDGRHLVVRDYSAATVYTYPDLTEVGTVDLPRQPQGEGIAVEQVDGDYRVLISSEGVGSEVLEVALPPALARAVAPEEPAATAAPAAPGEPGGGSSPGASGPGAEAPVPFDPQQAETTRPVLPFLAGGVLLTVVLVVLLRSLRPR